MSEAPITQKKMVSDLLCQLDTDKSMGPDGIHLRVMRELAKVLAKTLSITYQQSCLTAEILADWRLANVMPIYKKGWKNGPRELQGYQPDLSSGRGYGRDHPECHYMAHCRTTKGSSPDNTDLRKAGPA